MWMPALTCGLALTGCSTYPGWLPSAGPSRGQLVDVQQTQPSLPIQLVEVTDAVARRVIAGEKRSLFSETLGSKAPVDYTIGPGDVVEVSIWEAPPAVLFGSSMPDPRGMAATARVTAFPEQMVSSEGTINIPFAGAVPVAGKSPQKVEAEVVRRLTGKANEPQVLVRVIRNATSNVTVVGEVTSSTRMPLTARGERLLDALAAAGGVRQPVGKITLQVTRGDRVQALALDTIIRDPKQNIVLQPGDVVTALFQPLSFTLLGATGKNEELNFEAQGITLAQALARAGGLQDWRADARGVFIFRFEEPEALDLPAQRMTTPEGTVPVIYQVNLKDPASFFVAQSFPVHNKDVLYVSNAPGTELQKFLGIIMPGAYAALGIANSTK
ncbi:MAG: polysaccharide export protein [Candidatus Accumulibacter sp.]|nr:polysaccharide export protein [Accumulibacter sp.]